MRHFILSIFAALTIFVYANDFNESFTDAILKNDLTTAEDIIDKWKAASPEDPELYPALFNYYLSKARQEVVMISDTPDHTSGSTFVLSDSTGNQVGAIFSKDVWNDSILQQSFRTIDEGIEKYPSRIDFRTGKITLQRISGHKDEIPQEMSRLFDTADKINYRWTSTDFTPVTDSIETTVNAALDIIGEIFEEGDSLAMTISRQCADILLSHFPDEYRAINILGAIAYNMHDLDTATEYFIQADKIHPDDPLILFNIATAYYESGNQAKAIECFASIADNPSLQQEDRDLAADYVLQLKGLKRKMDLYTYEYSFMPFLLSQTKPEPGAFITLSNIQEITTITIPDLGYECDFDTSEMNAEIFDTELGKMIIYTYPAPTRIPLAKYGAVIELDGEWKYYTLEKSLEGYWVLGAQSADSHSNFGVVSDCTNPKQFADTVIGHLRKHNEPHAQSTNK